MAPDDWPRIEALFLDALDRDPAERADWLHDAADGDVSLIRQVQAMLEADAAPADLLVGNAFDAVGAAATAQMMEPSLERIGPWRVTGHLGTGGMGTVYRGERDDGAFEQTVALKLVKRGMDTDAVLSRFAAERRILARLSHPGIARILDAGRADDGRPCLVMEFVDGVPISDYCDERRLGVDARVDLVIAAGEAVAYAHQNLIVHRDLKPSNLLVSADGHVTLLDFGIAKLLADDDEGTHTVTGERVFTPSYAAPEQLRGGMVTTATDVYGLGAVLYSLLSGTRAQDTAGKSTAEVELAILNTDPARPSTVVTDASADTRGLTGERLRRRLRGDLDRIVLKALARDPAERYANAGDLVADLRRHRDGLPIEAQAPSQVYRLRKFVSRNRRTVGAALAGLAVVVAVSVLAFSRVRAERDLARREAATSEAVSTFMASLFASSDPRETGGREITARELLDQGSLRIADDLADEPVVQARMLQVAGDAYKSLQLMDDAEPLLQRALALRRQHLGEDHLDVAASHDALGLLFELQGRYPEAAASHRDALAVYRARRDAPPLPFANALHGMAFAQMRLGVLDSAEVAIRQALAIKRDLFGEDHEQVAYSLNILGDIHTFQGRYPEAIAVHKRALAIRRDQLGPGHLDVGSSLHNLGAAYRNQGDHAAAEGVYREALTLYRQHFGPDNQEVANTLSQLAAAVGQQGRLDEAETLVREAVVTIRRSVRPDHPRVATTLATLGGILADRGSFAESETAYREAIAARRSDLGADTPRVVGWLGELAVLASRRDRTADAEARLREATLLCDATGDDACFEVVDEARARLGTSTDR